MKTNRYIIFTDLDGTLLDHHSYSYEAARPALERIQEHQIPLILTSSKTGAEIEALRAEIDNRDPFIVENGGAIFIPEGYFQTEIAFQQKKRGYRVVELGTPYPLLRKALQTLREQTHLPLKGFGDLDAQELADKTGLPLAAARLAKQREYDEPFYLEKNMDEDTCARLQQLASGLGLSVTRGSRFCHLMGENDKGTAVRRLTSIFEREWHDAVTTVALGDSVNDLPMLAVVNLPIVVQKPSGEYDATLLQHVKPQLAEGVGPEGWNSALLQLFSPEDG